MDQRFLLIFIIPIFFTVAVSGKRHHRETTKPMVKRSIVRNFTDCGSQGEVLQVLIAGCSDPPCDLKIGQSYLVGAYFKSKVEHRNFIADFQVSVGGKDTTIVHVVKVVDVEQGMICAFGYTLSVTETLGLGPATLRISVSDDKKDEMCVLISGNIHT